MKKMLNIIMLAFLMTGFTRAAVLPPDGDLWTEDSSYSSMWYYDLGYSQGSWDYVTSLPSQGPGSAPINPIAGHYFVKSPDMWNTYTYVYLQFPGGPINLTDANETVDFWFMPYLYSATNMDLEIRLATSAGPASSDYKTISIANTTGRQWQHFTLPISSFSSSGNPDMSHVYGIGFLGLTGSMVNYCFDSLCIRTVIAEDQGYGKTQLSHGHEVLLKSGLIIDSIAPAYYWGSLNMENWRSSNFNSIQSLWGITDEGTSGNYGYWTDEIASNTTDYRKEPHLTNIQFFDEQYISDPCLLPGYASYITKLKNLYPNSIVYMNNQIANYYQTAFFDANTLRNFARTVKPDMLHYTEYPFRFQGITGSAQNYVGGSPTPMYLHMEMYRKVGLEGADGSCRKPIPTGMYTQQFRMTDAGKIAGGILMYNTRFPSESEMNLQTFAGWAFGFKKETGYCYANWGDPTGRENEMIAFSDVDGDNTPTAAFWQISAMNRESCNLNIALARLLSTDVRMKMGKHGSGTVNTLPSGFGVSIKDFSYMPLGYMTGGSVQNHPSTVNNGQEGDIVVGFFNSIFKDPNKPVDANETYFMVVNGLSDATADSNTCAQTIRLTFNFGTSGITGLQKIDRTTGEVVDVVSGWYSDGGANYHLDVTLGGGKGDLFKYKTSSSFIPEKPATILMQAPCPGTSGVFTNTGGISSLKLLWSKPVQFSTANISILNEHGTSIAKSVSGTGTVTMNISLTTPLVNDKYTLTISGITSQTGQLADGNNDGYIGGDALIAIEHRNPSDLNGDNKVNLKDFSAFAVKWLLN